MQTIFDTNLHLYWFVLYFTYFTRIIHYELFFLSDAIVVSINDDIDEVSEAYNDTIIALKLLLHSIELERVLSRLIQHPRGLELLRHIDKCG